MIEATIYSWLGGLEVELYPLAIPDDRKAPAIVYRIESEFTPDDGQAPYGASGHRIRLAIWHTSYKSASIIATKVREILRATHVGHWVSVDDRGDFKDEDTGLFGIVLDVEITALLAVTEAEQHGARGAAKAALIDNTLASKAVYASRVGFANSDQLPAIGISVQTVEIETGNAEQRRETELVVNLRAASTADSENLLEALQEEVEQVLHPDVILAGARVDPSRVSTQYTSIGRLHFEHRVMTFSLVGHYELSAPDSELPFADFSASDVEWNIDKDSAPEARDKLSLNP